MVLKGFYKKTQNPAGDNVLLKLQRLSLDPQLPREEPAVPALTCNSGGCRQEALWACCRPVYLKTRELQVQCEPLLKGTRFRVMEVDTQGPPQVSTSVRGSMCPTCTDMRACTFVSHTCI